MRQVFKKHVHCLLIGCCALFLLKPVFSQQQHTKSIPFGNDEKLEYLVSYHWGLIWIDAGFVSFEAKKGDETHHDSWHFLSTGTSLKHLDWLFRVRDTFEVYTFANPLQPRFFYRRTSEGGHEVFNAYTFDPSNGQLAIQASETGKADLNAVIQIPEQTTDVLTAAYRARSLDFSQMKIMDVFDILVLMDHKVTRLPILFEGSDTLTTPGGLRFSCLRFSTAVEKGTMFAARERIMVWVTDDANRIPVMIEAKIKVGTVKVHLQSFKNAAHPVTSLQAMKKK